jgi:hypothetical protein
MASLLDVADGLATGLHPAWVSGAQDGRHGKPAEPLRPLVVVLAGLVLAAAIVALATLIALGLDAFLHLDLFDLQFDQDPWDLHA